VGSMNASGGGAAALYAIQMLAQMAARTLHALLHGLLHRLHAARPGMPYLPAAAGTRLDTPRHAGTPRSADPVAAGAGIPGGDLPPAYGQSRVAVVARDPWSLFAHWEIPPVRRVEVLRGLGAEGEQTQEILRLYEPATIPPTFRDLTLLAGTGRAHIDVAHSGRTYRVDIGLRTASGRFVALAMSDLVSTPAAQPSDDSSARWVTLGPDGAATEVAVAWADRRVTTADTATARDTPPGAAPGRGGSSEALPPGPRARDALPIR
jgi:hypothetical protein